MSFFVHFQFQNTIPDLYKCSHDSRSMKTSKSCDFMVYMFIIKLSVQVYVPQNHVVPQNHSDYIITHSFATKHSQTFLLVFFNK